MNVNLHEQDKYVIFCSHMGQDEVEDILNNHWIGYKVLEGRFRGKDEISYIINVAAYHNDYFKDIIREQDSVLLLGEMERQGRRATLYNAKINLDQPLGFFKNVSKNVAVEQGNFTYDPSTNEYYVAIPEITNVL